MPLTHRIEDLQFVCFAVVFGIMTFRSRSDRTIRYVWCSYLLATLVAIADACARQPLSLLANSFILALLILRYAVLAAGIANFTGRDRNLAWTCFAIAGASFAMIGLGVIAVPASVALSFYYIALAVILLLTSLILTGSREVSTRIPRWLLACLFIFSAAHRLNLMSFILSARTPRELWMRDQVSFLNATIFGTLLPFTVVWMMNARDHAILLEQSTVDPLTNLLNRRGLADAATRELARFQRTRQDFAVAVCDLDFFKSLNDTHGHAFGDEVLQQAAHVLRDELRQSDIVARSGGEEFVLLLPLTMATEMLTLLDRVRTQLERRTMMLSSSEEVGVTISIGVTNTRGRTGVTWAELQKEADAALYQAKHTGRNRVCVAHEIPHHHAI